MRLMTLIGILVTAISGWPHYGGDAGGSRYSDADQINRENVSRLQVAWTYRTGDVSDGKDGRPKSKFEATPILFNGTLYVSTPLNRVIALDPASGKQRWTYDPEINQKMQYSEGLVSRGVSAWEDTSQPEGSACKRRIFIGTIDARLISIDADSGKTCVAFGQHGEIDLQKNA